jgi:hypothetical protein
MTYIPVLAQWRRRESLRFTVQEAGSWSERRGFARCARRIYRDDPYWVAEPPGELLRRLDPARNACLAGAEIGLFSAVASDVLTEGEVVGRLAAAAHPGYCEQCGENVGLWAELETINRPDVAAALFEAAEKWLADRLPDLAAIRGPVSLDPLHPAGILADGFNAPPAVLMPYHAPYYAELIEAVGYTVADASCAYRLDLSQAPAVAALRAAAMRITSAAAPEPSRMTLGALSALDMAPAGLLRPFLEAAWPASPWDLPPTAAALASALAVIASPELSAVIGLDGEPAAVGLAVPDTAPSRRQAAAWPWPLDTLQRGLLRPRPSRVRALPPWVNPDAYDAEVAVMLYAELLAAATRQGYRYAEISPVAQDDAATAVALVRLGAAVIKRYHRYEKRLAAQLAADDADRLW